MKILVLDDNREALFVIESFLKALDHKVSAFTDPQESLLWLKDVDPELIIADLDMPEMDGYSFAKRVRCYSRYASVPMVCMTGTEATDEEIANGGFQATLRKPVTLSTVMETIESFENGIPLQTPAGMPQPVMEPDPIGEPQPDRFPEESSVQSD